MQEITLHTSPSPTPVSIPLPQPYPHPFLISHSHPIPQSHPIPPLYPLIPSPVLTYYLIPPLQPLSPVPNTPHPPLPPLPLHPIPISYSSSTSKPGKHLGSTLDSEGLSVEDLRVRHGESGLIFGQSGNQDACDF